MRIRGGMPRRVKLELIEQGDEIEVVYKPVNGVTRTSKGIVASIEVSNNNTRLLSSDRGCIFTYTSITDTKNVAYFTIHSKLKVETEPLFEWDELKNVKERIA